MFVRDRDGQIIAQYGRGVGKINPMALEIQSRLLVVLFERHDSTICSEVLTVNIWSHTVGHSAERPASAGGCEPLRCMPSLGSIMASALEHELESLECLRFLARLSNNLS